MYVCVCVCVFNMFTIVLVHSIEKKNIQWYIQKIINK